MNKRGRPPMKGDTIHIPLQLLPLVKALKQGDVDLALSLFSEWIALKKNLAQTVDRGNISKLN